MGTVHPFARVRSFDPDTLQIMGVAIDCAWYQLMASGSALAASWRAEHTREALASRIIASARMGERDVERLRDDALADVRSLIVEPHAAAAAIKSFSLGVAPQLAASAVIAARQQRNDSGPGCLAAI